jgi:hypothetical protein
VGLIPGLSPVSQVQLRGDNVQVNDGSLDNVQVFPGQRPFFHFKDSETSIAVHGRNIVAGYNTSAGDHGVVIQGQLFFDQALRSGFSSSTDGGKTWASGFVPPLPGTSFTFGDPAVDVDRHGDFYYEVAALDATFVAALAVSKSTDGGVSWQEPKIVQLDDFADKPWIAVGPDPLEASRDNVYVTWTSLQPTGSQLRFGRSTDGGETWSARTIFAPPRDPNRANPQNALQFSNPYVDKITGRLYIPFLQFSRSNQDFIRILVSDDAGETFTFATFDVPGAPLPTVLPLVQAGTRCDCGNPGAGFRLTIHSGPNIGGRFGNPSYVNATMSIVQPAFAARNGLLYLAWAVSTSPLVGDANSHSNIMFIRSDDGGVSWTAPIQVNPTLSTDIHHILPTLTIDEDPNDVHIAYYTQHIDGSVDVDMANSHDRGNSFPENRTIRLTSTPSALPPSNIRISAPSGNNYFTENYDRNWPSCFSLGEYISARSANGKIYVLWGDARNTLTHPVNPLDPLSGQTHPQQDVFFQAVKAQ